MGIRKLLMTLMFVTILSTPCSALMEWKDSPYMEWKDTPYMEWVPSQASGLFPKMMHHYMLLRSQ